MDDDAPSFPTETLSRQLFELASTPFRLRSFRERWKSFGWSYRRETGEEFGFRVEVPGGWWLVVDPLGDEVLGARLPFHFWENYEPEDHDDPGQYSCERDAYDAAFAGAANVATHVLPEPFLRWTEGDGARAMVWEGECGLLILQQADFDPQFGREVHFWLEGCSRADFRATPPLVDALSARSRLLHEKRGFPPLSW